MKLKFIDQQYQTDAVNSIVDIFEGSNIKESLFTIDISKGLSDNANFNLKGEGVTYELGYSNKLTLDDKELLNNVRKIQDRNGILKSTSINGRNFTIEMETGERVIIVTGCINVLVSRVSGTLTKYNSCIA